MKDLIHAAKSVIDYWNRSWPLGDKLIQLRAAVERAEKQEAVGFDEWYESVTIDFENCEDAARRAWTAAQQAERERIRARTKIAAEKVWFGDWFVGPQHCLYEQFVEELLRGDDAQP